MRLHPWFSHPDAPKLAVNAVVIRVDHRFFTGYRRNGAVQTAWCLAGARLFMADAKQDMVKEIAKICRKRPAAVVSLVHVRLGDATQMQPLEGGEA